MFWGVSNVLGVFWSVLDKLLHFNLNIRVCCEQLGVHLFLGGVLHIWATVIMCLPAGIKSNLRQCNARVSVHYFSYEG